MRTINGVANIDIKDYNGMIKDLERLDALEVTLNKCLTKLVENEFKWQINRGIENCKSYNDLLKDDEWGCESSLSREIKDFAKTYDLTVKEVKPYVKALYETTMSNIEANKE